MTIKNDVITHLGKLIGSDEKDIDKLSYAILLEASGEYTNSRKKKFANNDFILSMIALNDCSDSSKLTRNCILSIGLACKMYKYYPNEAFNFLWKFRKDKKNIIYVSRGIWVFPQFLQQSDYGEFLIDLSKAKPEKDAIDMLYIILSNIYLAIDDKIILKELINIFNKYILKKPDLYSSKNEYLEMIEKLESQLN